MNLDPAVNFEDLVNKEVTRAFVKILFANSGKSLKINGSTLSIENGQSLYVQIGKSHYLMGRCVDDALISSSKLLRKIGILPLKSYVDGSRVSVFFNGYHCYLGNGLEELRKGCRNFVDKLTRYQFV